MCFLSSLCSCCLVFLSIFFLSRGESSAVVKNIQTRAILFARRRLFLAHHTFLSLKVSLSVSLGLSRCRRSEEHILAFGSFERQTDGACERIPRASARDDEIHDFLLEETTTTSSSSSSSSNDDNNNTKRFKEFVLSIHENRSRNDRARVTPAVRRDETRERNKRDTSRRGWWRERGDSVRVVPRWWFW